MQWLDRYQAWYSGIDPLPNGNILDMSELKAFADDY